MEDSEAGVEDRRDTRDMAWMFKRSSVCFPGQNNVVSGVTKCSSFALSPSVHRDLQQAGELSCPRD